MRQTCQSCHRGQPGLVLIPVSSAIDQAKEIPGSVASLSALSGSERLTSSLPVQTCIKPASIASNNRFKAHPSVTTKHSSFQISTVDLPGGVYGIFWLEEVRWTRGVLLRVRRECLPEFHRPGIRRVWFLKPMRLRECCSTSARPCQLKARCTVASVVIRSQHCQPLLALTDLRESRSFVIPVLFRTEIRFKAHPSVTGCSGSRITADTLFQISTGRSTGDVYGLFWLEEVRWTMAVSDSTESRVWRECLPEFHGPGIQTCVFLKPIRLRECCSTSARSATARSSGRRGGSGKRARAVILDSLGSVLMIVSSGRRTARCERCDPLSVLSAPVSSDAS